MLAAYNFTLPKSDLLRSISHEGDPRWLTALAMRLRKGDAVSIGVLGASVAQNGGCLTQPGKRCMAYRGARALSMMYGGRRPHKGFAVRLFELINATWPHREHTLVNAALDGTPAQVMLPCLFTHLPKAVQLVIVEFGSLALHLDHPSVEEVVRRLLSLQPPPAIVFLTVRGLCKRTPVRTNATIRYALHSHWELYTPSERTPWAVAEEEFQHVCVRYNVGCLSLYNAIINHMLAREPGYALSDVSLDCLHPFNGKRGTDMLTDLLVHWLHRGLLALQPRFLEDRNSASESFPLQPSLPTSVHTQGPTISSTCLSFAEQGRLTSPISQAMRNVEWRTAFCAPEGRNCSQLVAVNVGCPLEASRTRHRWAQEHKDAWLASNDKTSLLHVTQSTTQSLDHRHAYHSRRGTSPRAWGYCHFAQTPPGRLKRGLARGLTEKAKVSPGLAAIVPGAVLEVSVDTRVTPDGQADRKARIAVGLEHLTSYENMGKVVISCSGHCSCEPHSVDAHRTSMVRNESVFARHYFDVLGAHVQCLLRIVVHNSTSSGGFKFKVRSLTLAPATSPRKY